MLLQLIRKLLEPLGAFLLQIDDLFLATAEPFDETKKYRMTAADSKAMSTFMANIPDLPAGSNIKVPNLSCRTSARRHFQAAAGLCASWQMHSTSGGAAAAAAAAATQWTTAERLQSF